MGKGHDRLTGLLDRNGGYAAAGRQVSEAQLTGFPLSVLWVDIDRFHEINHSFGHSGGDRLVVEVARRIGGVMDPHTVLARMSGDEFVLLLPGVESEIAMAIARELERALEPPFEIEGVKIHPTLSIGVASLEKDEDAVRLLLRADRAKALAKRQGGNRQVLSGEKLAHNGYRLVREELEIEAKLRMAMETGGLSLHYQPILRPDGSVEALEALMRCHVGGEFIPPVRFIPVAEKTGLITRLGEWTLYEGASMARHLLNLGFRIKVAVNVSRIQLVDPRLRHCIHSALLCANLPPELLEVELTESLFLDTSPLVQANLYGIRDSGVGLAIDDFGTGYTSLAILKDIPATKLKLDRSFTLGLPDDRKAVAVVRSMTSLGHEMGMSVVAEGVETECQKHCLEALGVDAIQGYVNARPIPQEQLLDWLGSSRHPREAVALT